MYAYAMVLYFSNVPALTGNWLFFPYYFSAIKNKTKVIREGANNKSSQFIYNILIKHLRSLI